jgi:ribosomal protein S18 acetylase RimI-like enzyme
MSRFELKTLENIENAALVETFNAAFAGYFVKIRLNEESLANKILAENILLEKSVGAFVNGRLVGFILIGIDVLDGKKIAYNAGTGIISDFRGQGLTVRMYDFFFDFLTPESIHLHQLEVISTNSAAIKVYEKTGFTKTREFCCFKGKILSSNQIQFEINAISSIDDSLIETFWNYEPSYQNSLNSINRTLKSTILLGAFRSDELVGYIAFAAESGRVKQFGVAANFRNMGIGHALFALAQEKSSKKELSVINIDKRDGETIRFLHNFGFAPIIEQYEMILEEKY